MTAAAPCRADVEAAAARLAGLVRRTPVLRVAALDARAGAELWLKCENLQDVGAFKARGALHAASRLSEAQRARGLVTYSSGNHAQAVAAAARRLGVPATIAMPVDAPAIKVRGVERLGGTIVRAGTTSDDRRAAALEIVARTGAALIEPFDDDDVIAGQGTATLELLAQVAEAGGALDAVAVPVGGGGLVAGAALACEGTGIAVWGVEPAAANALGASLAAGERVAVPPGPTIADGLKPVMIGARNFAIARRLLAGAVTVDDDELGDALVALLLEAKVLVEPSGAAALAAALRGLPGRPARVGVILSGGNVAPELIARLLARHG
ncbi:MAG: threonine/serine dehydratase [Kofleriaceae bacterium]|nr:threonine/serine dehydratase [Kofleriaceae bacterium]